MYMPNNSEMYYATIKADLDHFMKLAQQYILIYSHQQQLIITSKLLSLFVGSRNFHKDINFFVLSSCENCMFNFWFKRTTIFNVANICTYTLFF